MNKVIAINLGGTAYQLEEGGYDTLRAYLETAAARLQGNPDRDEIMSDIEQAIGEKFRALTGTHKTVVLTKEVVAVLDEMGPIEDASGSAADPGAAVLRRQSPGGSHGPGSAPGSGAGRAGPPKRLYRIKDGAMIAGVCNGMAAYVNIDPTLVRLAFVLLTMVWGTGVLVYLVLAIVVPNARSPEEKAAACGEPFTAQEFIRPAKEGYYEAMKDFPDRKARREWEAAVQAGNARERRSMAVSLAPLLGGGHRHPSQGQHCPAFALGVARVRRNSVGLRANLAAGPPARCLESCCRPKRAGF